MRKYESPPSEPSGLSANGAPRGSRNLFHFGIGASVKPRGNCSPLRCTDFAERPAGSFGRASNVRLELRTPKCSNAGPTGGSSDGGAPKNMQEPCGIPIVLPTTRRRSSLPCFLRRFAAGASRCLSAKSRIRRRSSGRREASRGLELKCVPQRAWNGSARGPALETRDPGKLSTRRAAAAPRNALEPRGTGAP